ncbi:MAG: hypothetical protein HDS83_06555 [Bacteroidales bacterium]|nr:hypothetical protein [Bacteroidales bacterium]
MVCRVRTARASATSWYVVSYLILTGEQENDFVGMFPGASAPLQLRFVGDR